MTTSDHLIINWCEDPADADTLAAFFAQQVDSSYISHGELQLGRATDAEHWSLNLARLVADEIRGAQTNGKHSGLRVLTAQIALRLVAMALVSFHHGPSSCYLVLEDLVVDKALRHQGIGDRLLTWLDNEARISGCRQIFLESGIKNSDAHRFFERHGFRPCSVVMMKSVDV